MRGTATILLCRLALGLLVSVTSVWSDAFSTTRSERVEVALDAAIHIHTQYSTGSDDLAEVVDDARQLGIDVVVITDDDLLEVSYGLPPWRHLLRMERSYRSLLGSDTLTDYLAEIRRLDELHDDIIVIDGVESAPFYHWDIDPLARRATVRSWNKHLLAVGLDNAVAYRQLPILGGEGNWLAGRRWFLLWPIAGLIWAVSARIHRRVRWVVLVICCLFLGDSVLTGLRQARFHPYDSSQESSAFDAYFDAVHRSGGLSYWAHPEAASTIPPVQALGGLAMVASETAPHAQDLLSTSGYTGFAALYADHITATEAGHEWDQALGAYLRGERHRPVWGTGEIDYHENVEGNRLHDILTVVWVPTPSRTHVLESLRRGRHYAVRGGDERLRLRRFEALSDDGAATSGQQLSTVGESRILVELDKLNGSEEFTDIRLIRGDASGAQVVAHINATTPVQLSHVDFVDEKTRSRYYRLMARTRTSMLTSNPIFIQGPSSR